MPQACWSCGHLFARRAVTVRRLPRPPACQCSDSESSLSCGSRWTRRLLLSPPVTVSFLDSSLNSSAQSLATEVPGEPRHCIQTTLRVLHFSAPGGH